MPLSTVKPGITSLNSPILAHIHLPKCAGMSFNRLLENGFGHRFLRLYVDDTFYLYSQAELIEHVADPAVAAIASHFIREFPPSLAGRDLLYVTFLRDPVQQILSYITYCRKHYAAISIGDANLTASLPPHMSALSLREAAQWILTRKQRINFGENYATNYFAELAYQSRYGSGAVASRSYRHERLGIVQQILRRFFFVGISERMERSVQLLRALAQGYGVEFPDGSITVENTSYETRDDLTWLHPDDQVGSLLLRSVKEDRKLYDWACRRFDLLESALNQASPARSGFRQLCRAFRATTF